MRDWRSIFTLLHPFHILNSGAPRGGWEARQLRRERGSATLNIVRQSCYYDVLKVTLSNGSNWHIAVVRQYLFMAHFGRSAHSLQDTGGLAGGVRLNQDCFGLGSPLFASLPLASGWSIMSSSSSSRMRLALPSMSSY